MSLQLIAKQMEAKGRKGDSMLVHMTPGEVAGLQKLAESAGGSLSVNPETGLVEANFLKRMLPTLVGLGVGAATMNPFAGAAAGAAVGGYQAKRNDQDVGLGMLMGGLGGYGGASLAGGLGAAGAAGAAGTTAAGTTAGAAGAGAAGTATLTAEQTAQQLAAEELAKQQAAELAQRQAAELAQRQAAELATKQTANQLSGAEAAQNVMNSPTVVPFAERTAGDAAAQQFAQTTATPQAVQPTTYTFGDQSTLIRAPDGTYTSTPGTDVVVAKQPATYGENFENFKRGFGEMGNKAGRTEFGKEFGMTEAGAGIAPLMAPGKKPGEAPVDDEMYSYSYDVGRTGAERSPTSTSAEREYFRSSYSPVRKIKASQYAAQGGLMGLAAGGTTTAPAAPSGISSEGMTGASKAAFDYLMGRSAASGFAGQGVGRGGSGGTFGGGDGMYSFDPATGLFTRNPNYRDPEDIERERLAAEAAAEESRRRAAASEAQAQEAARARALPNITAPRQGSILAGGGGGGGDSGGRDGGRDGGGADVVVGGPIDLSLPQGTPLGDLSPGGDWSPSTDQDFGGGFNYGGDYDRAEGGLISLAKGGMASGGFVVPADVVSALGNGSTDAGLRKLHAMTGNIKPIKGKGDGLSDSIKTNIDGKQRAKVADGEAYIDPKTVKRLGGAKKLYAMMDKIRAQAHGKTSQQRPVNPAKVMA